LGAVFSSRREDPRDRLGLFDARDDAQPSLAAGTVLDLDTEHALQPPRPTAFTAALDKVNARYPKALKKLAE